MTDPKKQTTRMLKLACGECGWHCRTARKNIKREMHCPLPDCGGRLQQEEK